MEEEAREKHLAALETELQRAGVTAGATSLALNLHGDAQSAYEDVIP